MERLEQNITYQILMLRIEILKKNELWRECIKKNDYGKEAVEINSVIKDLYKKLDAIENELKAEYESLEMTSENIKELQRISNLLLEFKDFDETLLNKIENKVSELIIIKEKAIKEYDFKTAKDVREEIHQLQKYLNENKNYLIKIK